MSDQIEKYENMSDDEFVAHRFPKGDIFYNYEPDESPEKFDYLKAKYLFRFPFTITAIKWGFALGCFFGLHTYIKTSKVPSRLSASRLTIAFPFRRTSLECWLLVRLGLLLNWDAYMVSLLVI